MNHYENKLEFKLELPFGIDYKCNDWSEEEKKAIDKYSDMLEIKSQHKELTTEDFLRTLRFAGLDEKVFDDLDKIVKTQKRKHLFGFASSIGVCAMLKIMDLPNTVETLGYITAASYMLANSINYFRIHLGEKYINHCLKN